VEKKCTAANVRSTNAKGKASILREKKPEQVIMEEDEEDDNLEGSITKASPPKEKGFLLPDDEENGEVGKGSAVKEGSEQVEADSKGSAVKDGSEKVEVESKGSAVKTETDAKGSITKDSPPKEKGFLLPDDEDE